MMKLPAWSLLYGLYFILFSTHARSSELKSFDAVRELDVELHNSSVVSDDPHTICLPCICHENNNNGIVSVVDCSGQNLTRIPLHLPETTVLNFSRNRLITDDSTWSLCKKSRSLRNVSFAWNELTSLPISLKGCQNTLEDLTLTGNWLTLLDPSVFSELQSLQTLHGLWVKNELSSTAFLPLKILSHLDMAYRQSTIPEDLFIHLSKLGVLLLTLPRVQALPEDLVLPPGLMELRLHGVMLKHLPTGFLNNLLGIHTLHLDLPELRRLDWEAEGNDTSQLQHLTIKGVWEVNSRPLVLLTSLKSLKLQDVRIVTDAAFLGCLGNLTNLEIINSPMADSSLHWVRELKNLKSLSLKQTQLLKLSADTLSGLSSLENLDLSFNHLKEIPEGFLSPVSATLEGLDISSNFLDHLPRETFPRLQKLKGLDLSQNSLTSLDLDILVDMHSLSQLIVKGNALTDVLGDRIGYNSSFLLMLLDLSNNLLQTIPESIPLDRVITLDMSGNPLTKGFNVTCMLSTPTLVMEIHDTRIACTCDVLRLAVSGSLLGGVCKSPASFRDKPIDQLSLSQLCGKAAVSSVAITKETWYSTLSLDPSIDKVRSYEMDNKEDTSNDDDDDYWIAGSIKRTLGPIRVSHEGTDTNAMKNHDSQPSDEIENKTHSENLSDSVIKTKSEISNEQTDIWHELDNMGTPGHTSTNAVPSHVDNGQANNYWTDKVKYELKSDIGLNSSSPRLPFSNMTNKSQSTVPNIGQKSLDHLQAASDQEGYASPAFPHMPWIITICFLLILLIGYIVYRNRAQRGTHELRDDLGTDNKGIIQGKMELMELGVAPEGSMPVIM